MTSILKILIALTRKVSLSVVISVFVSAIAPTVVIAMQKSQAKTISSKRTEIKQNQEKESPENDSSKEKIQKIVPVIAAIAIVGGLVFFTKSAGSLVKKSLGGAASLAGMGVLLYFALPFLKDKFENYFDAFSNKLFGKISKKTDDIAKNIFGRLDEKIRNIVDIFDNKISQISGDADEAVKNLKSEIINELKREKEEFLQQLNNIPSNIKNGIVNKVKEKYNNVKESLVDKVNDLKDAFTGKSSSAAATEQKQKEDESKTKISSFVSGVFERVKEKNNGDAIINVDQMAEEQQEEQQIENPDVLLEIDNVHGNETTVLQEQEDDENTMDINKEEEIEIIEKPADTNSDNGEKEQQPLAKKNNSEEEDNSGFINGAKKVFSVLNPFNYFGNDDKELGPNLV